MMKRCRRFACGVRIRTRSRTSRITGHGAALLCCCARHRYVHVHYYCNRFLVSFDMHSDQKQHRDRPTVVPHRPCCAVIVARPRAFVGVVKLKSTAAAAVTQNKMPVVTVVVGRGRARAGPGGCSVRPRDVSTHAMDGKNFYSRGPWVTFRRPKRMMEMAWMWMSSERCWFQARVYFCSRCQQKSLPRRTYTKSQQQTIDNRQRVKLA